MNDYEKAQYNLEYVLREEGHSIAGFEKLLSIGDYINQQEQHTRALVAELDEQARLHGMGSEREAKQLTRIHELECCLSRLNMAALNAIHYLPGGETKAELRDRYDEATELLETPR